MTKVARLFEEEKEEALKEKDAIIKQKDEAFKQVIKNMIIEGADIDFIMKTTGVSEAEIKELQKSLNTQKS